MKKLDEVAENHEEKNEEIVEEVKAEAEEPEKKMQEEEVEKVELDFDSQIKNMKKNDASKLLVKKARIIIKDAEHQLDECKLLLASDLKDYDNAVQKLKANGMDASEELLTQLGYVSDEEESEENKNIEDVVVFEPKEELAPLHIKDVSSGKFTGFIMGLLGGVVTFGGMAFVASEKLGITVDLSQLTTMEPVYSFYSRLIGLKGDMFYGRIFMILVALLIVWLIYKIRVSMKASANLNHSTKQLAVAEEYSVQKGTCKEEMDKVDTYIHESIGTLKTYQIILNEQKGKLERIKHLEYEKIETSDFHHKSMLEMKDTQELISVIKDFMSVPMSEEGKLSDNSNLFLQRAKDRIQKVLDRLY